jgi:hypothetical protein
MASSVRECISVRQAGCPCRLFRFSALAQVSGPLSHLAASQGVLLAVVLAMVVALLLALLAAVAFTAIWSARPTRSKVALAVLDRLLRWRP